MTASTGPDRVRRSPPDGPGGLAPPIVAALMATLAGAGAALAQAPATDIWLLPAGADGGEARNVTERPGYDNQPSFTPDGRALLYTSVREDGQADTYRLDLETGRAERLTRTAESEYSPTVLPGGEGFSVVRVERDSAQRLWAFDRDGGAPRLLVEDVAPVGYHAWAGPGTVALFVLGEPPTLRLVELGSGAPRTVARDIGRSLHPVPERRAVAFLQRRGAEEGADIRVLDVGSGAVETLAPALEGSEDFAWTPDGRLLMARDRVIHVLRPGEDDDWRPLVDLGARVPGAVTRLAVSPDGRTIAAVAGEDAAP